MTDAPKIRKTTNLGALHTLLISCCPPVDGVQSIPILAGHLKIVDPAIYGWIRRNRIPYRRAKELVELNEKRLFEICGYEQTLSMDHFKPYL